MGAITSTLVAGVQSTAGAGSLAVRDAINSVLDLPSLAHTNAVLRARNEHLASANAALRQRLAEEDARAGLLPLTATHPHTIQARVIGFPPEGQNRTMTIDQGSRSGIRREDGVLDAYGVVGRITSADPFTSTVTLITDYTSCIPAIVRRGRWWGIVRGNLTSLHLDYVSQDAHLRIGQTVVTGKGRSFHAGDVIGRIVKIERSDASLYQTAILRPSARLSALDRVLVVTK
ncbi:MAG: rod shape-determining protein MreC [Vulcanimicrobiaceae bacterium]